MEGKEFLIVAQKFVQMRSEAAIRSAESRAYYDMENRDFQSPTKCEFDIARAKLAITQLESCYQQPLRNQLKDGIQEYERKINSGSIGAA